MNSFHSYSLYAAVSAYDVANKDYWDWNKGPMPWEGGNC